MTPAAVANTNSTMTSSKTKKNNQIIKMSRHDSISRSSRTLARMMENLWTNPKTSNNNDMNFNNINNININNILNSEQFNPHEDISGASSTGHHSMSIPNSIPNQSRLTKVFGREWHMEELQSAYSRITRSQSELVLVHGVSGTGKSSLVRAFTHDKLQELHRQTYSERNVFFAQGKFDQLQSHSPYAALVMASNQLCDLIMACQEDERIKLQRKIEFELGPEIQLLANLIPKLARIFKPKNGTGLGPNASAGIPRKSSMDMVRDTNAFTRFKLLFRRFLRSVASRQHPLILFLDDLQWADKSSLEVIRSLLSDRSSKHILIICAYRDDELPKGFLDRLAFDDPRDEASESDFLSLGSSSHGDFRAVVTDIPLGNLDAHSLNRIVAHRLEMEEDVTRSLGDLIFDKTDGNPFYVVNFLDMLQSSGFIVRDETSLFWTWDEDRIKEATDVSDNLAAILETKILRLPDFVRSILQLASFIGHRFSIDILVTIVYEEQDMIETEYTFEKHSREVIQRRIVKALMVATGMGLLETTYTRNIYKFSHDKIQLCLYKDLIPDEVERRLLHQRIGKLIWKTVQDNEDSRDDWIVFLAADNLNRGTAIYVQSAEDRYELIELNLTAAKLASHKAAFLASAEYLRMALKQVEGEPMWVDYYDLCMELHCIAAEIERTLGCYDKSRRIVKEIHKRAKTIDQHLPAYLVELNTLWAKGDLKGAVDLGLIMLRKLGIKFPKKITKVSLMAELVRTKMAIGSKGADDILELPIMTNERLLLALRVMGVIVVVSFCMGEHGKNIFVTVCLRMTRLTVRYGLSALHSPVAFATFGALHSALGMYDKALKVEELSKKLLEKLDAQAVEGRVLILCNSTIHCWRHQMDMSLHNDFLRQYQLAMSFGDVDHAYLGFLGWLHSGFYLGVPLQELSQRAKSTLSDMVEFGARANALLVSALAQVMANLMGDDDENKDPAVLRGEFVEEYVYEELGALNHEAGIFSNRMMELIVGVQFENHDHLEHVVLPFFRKNESTISGYFTTGFDYFHYAMAAYNLYQLNGKNKHKREALRAHKRLRKWVRTGTTMLDGPCKLLDATRLEVLCKGKSSCLVEEEFKNAIKACNEQQYLIFEAMCNERLAKYFFEKNASSVGDTYLSEAMSLYKVWDAERKVEWLREHL